MQALNLWFLQKGKPFSGGRNLSGKIVSRYLGKSCLKINKIKYRFLDMKRRCFPKQDLKIVKLVRHSFNKVDVAILRLPGGFLTAVTIAQEAIVTLKTYLSNISKISLRNMEDNTYTAVLLNDIDDDFVPSFSATCKNLPIGTIIHNIEIFPGTGAKLVRSAGTSAIYLNSKKHYNRSIIRMKTGEIRKIHQRSIVCLGTVSNPNHLLFRYNNAGAARRAGKQPVVRASAKNAVDHPMGGRTKGGCQPVSRKGVLSRGPTTRKHTHYKDLMLLLNRRKAKILGRTN